MLSTTSPVNGTNVRRYKAGGAVPSWIALAPLRAKLALASLFVPGQAAEIAARLFSTPPRHAHTARERELLAIGANWQPSTAQPDLTEQELRELEALADQIDD